MAAEVDIARIIRVIRGNSNYDFSDYSEKSFNRRVEKILFDYDLDMDGLIEKLHEDENFLEQVVREITVNTTELFRDTEAWHAIKYRVLAKLKNKEEIRIWHAGSSTGQEIYSMTMLLYEMGLYDRTQILATDINTDVLKKAEEGVYQYRFNREYLENFDKVMRYNPYNYEEVLDVPEEKYFIIDKVADTLSIRNFLKERIEFKKHDLVQLQPPSPETFDIILCRNVLIYFNYQLQNRVFDLFYNSLATKGFLILGKHESMLGPKANKFNKRGVFYTKKSIF